MVYTSVSEENEFSLLGLGKVGVYPQGGTIKVDTIPQANLTDPVNSSITIQYRKMARFWTDNPMIIQEEAYLYKSPSLSAHPRSQFIAEYQFPSFL